MKSTAANRALPSYVCPNDQRPLTRSEASYRCDAGHEFPIKGGIPRFVPPSTYADSFSLQWNHFRRTQLDSYTGTTITRDRLRGTFGEEVWHLLRGSTVLEAGCGAGRFTEILLAEGALVASIDLSTAVEANAVNCPQTPQHEVAQADILALPFAEKTFDIVACVGVLQNTPDPEKCIESLAARVRPGGWLIVDTYRHAFSWYTKTAPLFRRMMRRLPPERRFRAVQSLVRTLLPLHKATRRFRPAQIVLSRLSPVLVYYNAFPQLSDELQEQWAFLDTHDALASWYTHRRTPRSLEKTLKKLGLVNVYTGFGGNGIDARGQRPG